MRIVGEQFGEVVLVDLFGEGVRLEGTLAEMFPLGLQEREILLE